MNGKKRIHAIIWIGVTAILVALTLTGVITTVPSPDGKSNVVEDVTYWVIEQGSFNYEKEHCQRYAKLNSEQEAVTNYKTAFTITHPDFSLEKYLQQPQREQDIIYQLSETTYLFYSTGSIPSAAFLDRLSRGKQQASL
ncbi:MAG TPA: hypothetical protein VJB39_01510 [Patescibacteria group bacterium]|nr:hypothetical protein [Patescibacteria group bacterium]